MPFISSASSLSYNSQYLDLLMRAVCRSPRSHAREASVLLGTWTRASAGNPKAAMVQITEVCLHWALQDTLRHAGSGCSHCKMERKQADLMLSTIKNLG